jgi:hypothetical protein
MKNPANILVTGAILAWAGVAGAATAPSDQNDSACSGAGVMFADFATKDNYSNFGGYWFAASDTSSEDGKNADSATGGSTIALNGNGKIWNPIVGRGAAALPIGVLHANLEKNNPNSKYTYHPYAGWADLGVQVSMVDGYGADLTGLKAISFEFYAGADLTESGVVPPTGQAYGWSDKVPGLIFKADSPEIGSADAYQIEVPVSKAGGKRVCVELDSLERPSNRVKVGDSSAIHFDPSNITNLRWETRIADQGDSAIHSANVTFGIANVKFYGIDSQTLFCSLYSPLMSSSSSCDDGIKNRSLGESGLRVAYDQGLTLSYAFQGAEPVEVEVLRVDGARVASFSRQATVANHLRLPIALTRGTYLVNVRSGKSIRSARLAVVR